MLYNLPQVVTRKNFFINMSICGIEGHVAYKQY